MPLIAGALWDVFADLARAWLLMAVGIVCLIGLALRYSPDSYRDFGQALQRPDALSA